MNADMKKITSLISDFEITSRDLDTSARDFSLWMDEMKEFLAAYLAALPEDKTYRNPAGKPELEKKLSPAPQPLSQILKEYKDGVLSLGINPTSGRFFGYVPGGGIPSAAIGDLLAAITNRYAGVYQASPGSAEIENLTVKWLLDMIGYPESAWGTLQSGGTLSTLTAIIAARETRPFEEWPRSVIYYSGEIHNAIPKSLKVAGLNHVPVRKVDVDNQFRMSVAHLDALIREDLRNGFQPWMAFCSAGTVNTGAVDPLLEISGICKKYNIWMHVDAAYGGFFILTENGRRLLSGMNLADSVVLDPHKGLFLPYGCGAVLVKDGSLLKKAFTFHSDYLADVQDLSVSSPADYSPELTRHFRALRLWLSLKIHGLERFRAALEERLLLAQYAHQQLGNMENIERGPAPQLSCVTLRIRDDSDEPTSRLLRKILDNGRVHLSSTRLNGKLFLRMCILCLRSHKADVDAALEEIAGFLKIYIK